MEVQPTNIEGCKILRPYLYKDSRGWFYEAYNKERMDQAIGRSLTFLQDNLSRSGKYVLRGLHFQKGPYAQSKLVSVLKGRVLDVVVDLRKESPSYLETFCTELSAEQQEMLFIPAGLAHGFLSLEEGTLFHYKCDGYYRPDAEAGIRYDDPDLSIDWGVDPDRILLSEKDQKLPFLKSFLK